MESLSGRKTRFIGDGLYQTATQVIIGRGKCGSFTSNSQLILPPITESCQNVQGLETVASKVFYLKCAQLYLNFVSSKSFVFLYSIHSDRSSDVSYYSFRSKGQCKKSYIQFANCPLLLDPYMDAFRYYIHAHIKSYQWTIPYSGRTFLRMIIVDYKCMLEFSFYISPFWYSAKGLYLKKQV